MVSLRSDRIPLALDDADRFRSGIVSLLFCGVTLKHYAYHTMSVKTQKTTKYMFAVMSQLSENFIFIYLGLNLFTQDAQVFKPLFIIVTAVCVVVTRNSEWKDHELTAVYPCDRSRSWPPVMQPSSPYQS